MCTSGLGLSASSANALQSTYISPQRVVLHQLRNRRLAGGQRIVKGAHTAPFVHTEPPAVRVNVGGSSATAETAQTEGKVGRFGAIETQDLAHAAGRDAALLLESLPAGLVALSGCCLVQRKTVVFAVVDAVLRFVLCVPMMSRLAFFGAASPSRTRSTASSVVVVARTLIAVCLTLTCTPATIHLSVAGVPKDPSFGALKTCCAAGARNC